MVGVNKSDDKFAQFLASSSSQDLSADKLYDIDLDIQKINGGNAHGDFFSILGCEEGTVMTQCGGFGCSGTPTCVCMG